MEPLLISYILVRNKTLWSCITPYWACRLCLACQHFDFNSVHRFSDNLHVNSSCKLLFTNKGKGIWLLISANVPRAGTCDKPLRCGRLAFSWTPKIFWSNLESQKYTLPDPREEYEDACRLHNWQFLLEFLLLLFFFFVFFLSSTCGNIQLFFFSKTVFTRGRGAVTKCQAYLVPNNFIASK